MQVKISKKGEIVLGASIRRRLALREGDALEVRVQGGKIVLTPRKVRSKKVRIVVDRLTGFPALTAGPDAQLLTSKQVEKMLSDFP